MQLDIQSHPKIPFAVRRYNHLAHILAMFIVFALFLAACSSSPSGTGNSGNGSRVSASPVPPSTPFPPTPTPTPYPPTASLNVYVGSQPVPGNAGSIVYALSASNGSRRWQYQTSIISISLAEDNGVIYAVGSDAEGAGGIVYALRSSDGSVIWKRVVNGYGLLAPQTVNGVLYTASLLNGTVYALKTSDGSVLWQTRTTHGNTGVNFMLISGSQVYVTGITDGTLYALRATDGSLQWKYSTGKEGLTPPQTDANNVYVLAVSSAQAPGTLLALQRSSGRLRWSYQNSKDYVSEPALSGGNVYVDVSNGNVYALRGTDGSTLWHTSMGSAGSWSSPTIAGDVLYVANTTHKVLYALRLNNGSLLWHAAIEGSAVTTSISIDVVENVVYVFTAGKTGGSLVALSSSNGSALWYKDGNPLSLLAGSPAKVANGILYYIDTNTGIAYSLKGNDGSVLWDFPVGKPATGETNPLVLGQ